MNLLDLLRPGAKAAVAGPVQRAPQSAGFRAALPWLLCSLCISLSALIGNVHLPFLLAFVGCAVWRQQIERSGRRLPTVILRLAVFVPSILGLLLIYGAPPRHAALPVALLTFLVALLSLKVLELRSHRDFIVVALIGFFMILSAFFYNQTLALSLYLALAVATNIIALIRCHDGGRKHGTRAGIRLGLGLVAQAVPLVVALFIVFPRVQGDWLRMPGGMTGTTGMSGHLQPGAVAELAQSTATVFRAKIVAGKALTQRNLYWRGLVLGTCDSPLSWEANTNDREVPLARWPKPGAFAPAQIVQQITVKANGEHWLFALDEPVGVKAVSSMRPQLQQGNVLRSHAPLSNNAIYLALSDLHATDAAPLDAGQIKWLTDVPGALSPAVRALVEGWVRQAQGKTGAARENAIITQALLFFRDSGFVYTLSPGVLPKVGALDYFLFHSRRGFCEHYAAAFSTLMRAAGLPARVVIGYQGGEYNDTWGGYYLIRQSDAHAWSEVWISGRGWQREDPTAVVAPDRLSLGAEDYEAMAADGTLTGESRLDRLAGLKSPGTWRWLLRNSSLAWDGLDQQWNLVILGYDQDRRENTLQGLGLGNLDWVEGAVLAVAAAFSLLALGAMGVRALERVPVVEIDPAARLYRRFCQRIAQLTGIERAASEGPVDFSRRASGALPEQARQIQAVTDLYIRSRYAAPVHDDLAIRTLEALTEAVDNIHEPAGKS
jgi:hypothetical protein